MSDEKLSFVVREEWSRLITGLKDEDAGALIKAICNYKLGDRAEIKDETIRAIFNSYQITLDKDDAKYKTICEHRRENGRKGGLVTQANAKQKQANAKQNEAKASKSKQKQADYDNEYEYEYEYENLYGDSNKLEAVREIFNTSCCLFLPCSGITKARADKINTLLDGYTLEEVKETFEKANNTEWLLGKNPKGWKATFDWLIDINNFVKVREGNYDITQGTSTPKKSDYDIDAFLEEEERRNANGRA